MKHDHTFEALVSDVEQGAYMVGWQHGRRAGAATVRLRGWAELILAFALGACIAWGLE